MKKNILLITTLFFITPIFAQYKDISLLTVEEEDIMSESITEDELEEPSENNSDVKLEEKDPIASSGGIEEKVPESVGGDTADFDIQEFLDELENLPSENDSETEK